VWCANLVPSVILLGLLAEPSLRKMAQLCLLFTAHDGTAEILSQALTALGLQGEHCSAAAEAMEKASSQVFQIAIIDWDLQPEAGLVLKALRERKAAVRPLTLAIVSEDIGVPKALQAGANSILRKPVLLSAAKDTLTTARDLLRARQSSGTGPAQAAGSAASPAAFPPAAAAEKTLRAGEFLQSSPTAPGGQFVTETDFPDSLDQSIAGPVDPLEELEPVAAAAPVRPTPAPEPASDLPDEPKTLEWYLKTRGGRSPQPIGGGAAAAPAPARATKAELLGFDQTPSYSAPTTSSSEEVEAHWAPQAQPAQSQFVESAEPTSPAERSGSESGEARSGLRLGKGAIVVAVMLAGVAIAMAPQAPWHSRALALWSRARLAAHAWLNPQPVAPAQAPPSHENFGQAGDEYKLPVAENIPDATTDPSQIRVVPVIDPTAKNPNSAGGAQGSSTTGDSGSKDSAQAPEISVQENPAANPPSAATTGNVAPSGMAPTQPTPVDPVRSNPVVAAPSPPVPLVVPPRYTPPAPAPNHVSGPAASGNTAIPSSLRSQMASMTPDTGGNKPVEAALPSIEPVVVAEGTERGLLADQPAIPYPAGISGQQGTVVLQVLIGRDGTVQDAKFLQGSLMFARAAIEGVKQWKFRPYLMNGRAASVQTTLTVSFKPGA